MLHLILDTALLVQADPAQGADKAASELRKKLEEQVMKAKTLHVEFEAIPEGRDDKIKGELKLGENGAFLMKVGARNETYSIRSDGRTVTVVAPRSRGDVSKWSPATV